MRYWIGFDIGGTKIAAHLVDEMNQVKWEAHVPVVKGDGLLPAIFELVDDALTHIKGEGDLLEGIGLGIPGKIVRETGEIHLATNLNIESPLAIGAPLKERYDTAVALENDVRLGAFGVQNLHGLNDLAYISIGTGLAAGFILNGELYRGQSGLAGEIGHIAEAYNGRSMILENIVSGPGLVQEGLAANCQVASASDLFVLAESGSAPAEKVLQNMFDHLARAIQWIALTFDLEKIILGGGVTHAGPYFETGLRQAVAQLRKQSKITNLLLNDDKLMILPTSANVGLWGATYLVKNSTRPSRRKGERLTSTSI